MIKSIENMAISMSKKKSKASKKSDTNQQHHSSDTILFKILNRVPLAIFVLILIFIWSSSTTIISGKFVHVCVSSRKLNNLYCLSAGTQPNFDIPIPSLNNNDTLSTGSIKEVIDIEDPNSIIEGIVQNNGTVGEVVFARKQVEDPNSIIGGTVQNNGTIGEVVFARKQVEDPNSIIGGTVQNNGTIGEVVFARKQVEDPNSIIGGMVQNNGTIGEVVFARKQVEAQLQIQRSWISNTNHQASSSSSSCDGKGIYVYDLPSKFNKDLVGQCGDMIPWSNVCKYFDNEAMGEPIATLGNGWYRTHQYALELIFHTRALKHRCRVYDENEAKLFYVPFYGGLDILRWHFKNVSNDVKDTLGLELVKWLENKKPWMKNSGKDHVFVLGKISWDFRRKTDASWGTRLLELDQMQNSIKLLIERQPWHVNDIGIPHPTYFHPHSDDDIINWQLKTIRSNRKSLISFAGAARPGAPENIRSILIDQCNSNDTECKFLNCSSGGCDKPESVIELFMDSEFCLQPPGDSPTRKSVFDSLVSGCIPVLFDPFTAYYQYPWHLPEDHSKYSVFIDQEQVRQMEVNIVDRLMKIPTSERDNMRRFIVYELLPGLVYGDSNSKLEKFQDAFSITMNNLIERVTKIE